MSQKALNRVLTLKSSGGGPALPESSGILEKGWICVELWSFYCSKRISVPMLYISSWDIRVYLNLRIQGRMQIFKKKSQKALNRVLTLPNYSTGPGLLISSGIIDLQNNGVCE